MKGVILKGNGIVKVDTEIPLIQDEDDLYGDSVVVKVKYAGICGSDLPLTEISPQDAITHQHIPIGHEVVGTIDKLPFSSPDGYQLGDRVVVYHTVGCGWCYQCQNQNYQFCINGQSRIGWEQQGGMAEYISVPARNLVKIPDNVSDEQAVMCACAGGTISNAFGDYYNGDVLVIGLGAVGVCGLIYACYNQKPCNQIGAMESTPIRTALAMEIIDGKRCVFYASDDAVYSPESNPLSLEFIREDFYDFILECSGTTNGRQTALNAVRPNETINFIGYGEQEFRIIPSDHLIQKQLTARGIYAMPYDILWEVINVDSPNGLDFTPAISKIMPLDEAEEAFRIVRSREAIKVILNVG